MKTDVDYYYNVLVNLTHDLLVGLALLDGDYVSRTRKFSPFLRLRCRNRTTLCPNLPLFPRHILVHPVHTQSD